MRRLTIIIAVLGLGWACDLEEELAEELCLEDQDCWHSQDCVRTSEEKNADLPGLCLPKGDGCLVGEQLGCACDDHSCTVLSPRSSVYPELECSPDTLTCALASDFEEQTEG
ncbi:MAG: hypothetical protein K0V04_43035 [Deltaproteobacteria bacterium]|nr:hypothetical protein [Deltaproteobacteria bacterium]